MEKVVKDDVKIIVKIDSKLCGAVEDSVIYSNQIFEKIDESMAKDVETMSAGLTRNLWKRFLMIKADVKIRIEEKQASIRRYEEDRKRRE